MTLDESKKTERVLKMEHPIYRAKEAARIRLPDVSKSGKALARVQGKKARRGKTGKLQNASFQEETRSGRRIGHAGTRSEKQVSGNETSPRAATRKAVQTNQILQPKVGKNSQTGGQNHKQQHLIKEKETIKATKKDGLPQKMWALTGLKKTEKKGGSSWIAIPAAMGVTNDEDEKKQPPAKMNERP